MFGNYKILKKVSEDILVSPNHSMDNSFMKAKLMLVCEKDLESSIYQYEFTMKCRSMLGWMQKQKLVPKKISDDDEFYYMVMCFTNNTYFSGLYQLPDFIEKCLINKKMLKLYKKCAMALIDAGIKRQQERKDRIKKITYNTQICTIDYDNDVIDE